MMDEERPPGFEWDADKAVENERRHGVSFQEATTVFDDPWAITEYDYRSSSDEDRELTIGMTAGARIVVVSYTARCDAIRIISARPAERRERRHYETEASHGD